MMRPCIGPGAKPSHALDGASWPGPFSRLPLVRHLSPATREEFFAAFDARTVDAGETLSRQHERDTHFHIVLDGSCEVSRVDAAGAVVWRRTVATGAISGTGPCCRGRAPSARRA